MIRKKVILSFVISTMVFSTSSTVFASTANENLNLPTAIYELDTSITKSSKDKVIKEFVNKTEGSKANKKPGTAGKKADYVEKHYKIGYERNNAGDWTEKAKNSGTSREHLDPISYIGGFLYN